MAHHQQVLHSVTFIHKHCSDNFLYATTNLSSKMMQPVMQLHWHVNIGNRAHGNWNACMQELLHIGEGDGTIQIFIHPRMLLLLWYAYLHGLGDNKTTKDFTRA